MNIIRMKLENVLSWKTLDLNFEELSFALFIGLSGSGKSNIFDALAWILFDDTARKKYGKNNVIRDIPKKQPQAIGTLWFEDEGIEYEVSRARGKVSFLKIKANGGEFGQRNPTLAQLELERILGMNFNTFLNIAYFSQGDSGTFLSSDSTERIKIISSILALSEYDRAYEVARVHVKEREVGVAGVKGNIEMCEKTIADTDIKTVRSELKMVKVAYGEVLEEITQTSQYLNNLRKKKELKYELNATRDKYNTIKESFEEYQESSINTKKKLEKDYATLSKVRKRLSELKSQIKEVDLIEEKIGDVDSKISTLENSHDSLKAVAMSKADSLKDFPDISEMIGKECPTCLETVTENSLENVKKKKDEIKVGVDKLKNQIRLKSQELETQQKEKDRLEGELSKLSKVKSEQTTLMVELTRLGGVKNDIDSLTLEINEKKSQIKEKLAGIKTKYAKLKKDYSVYDEYDLNEMEACEEKSAELDQKESQFSRKIAELEQICTHHQKAVDTLVSLQKKLKEVEGDFEKASFWKKQFPLLKLKVISETIPMIEAMTNQYLSQLVSGVKVVLEIDPTKATNKIGVKIAYETGTTRSYEGWSGGEKSRMSTAVFMALNQLASMRSGKKVNFLMLDEKLAAIDSQSRPAVFELLRSVYSERKLFTISHVENIEQEFDQVIRVGNKDGLSEISDIEVWN